MTSRKVITKRQMDGKMCPVIWSYFGSKCHAMATCGFNPIVSAHGNDLWHLYLCVGYSIASFPFVNYSKVFFFIRFY